MKVRIKPTSSEYTKFAVQQREWYGWRTIYEANILKYCLDYIEDLKQIANVEFVKI